MNHVNWGSTATVLEMYYLGILGFDQRFDLQDTRNRQKYLDVETN